MKRTALILAGAAAFDLGIMVVAAQAHQGLQDPPPSRADDFVNQGLITNSNNKLQVDVPPSRPTDGTAVPGTTSGAVAVWDPTGTGGCTPGGPLSSGTANPCAPGAISDQAAAGNLSANAPRAQASPGKMANFVHIKIDRVNTIQACRARRGEVVMLEGAQQCRVPAR